VQQSVEPQPIGVERVGGQFPGQLPEHLFDLVGHAHVEHALHQRFDREQMSIDVLKVGHGLLQCLSFG